MKKIVKSKYGDYETQVRIPMFANYHVHIIFADDLKTAWGSRFKSTLKIGEDCKAFHQTWHDGYSRLFFKTGDCTTCTVAHECFHAVAALLKFAGVKYKEEEVIAYALDYIVQGVQNFKNDLIDQKVAVKSRKKKR